MDLSLIRDFSSPYPFMMPQKAHFIRMTKAWDLRKTDTVVFYEQGKGWFATRAAFMLKAFGHQNVYVLDGGIAKWTKEGRDVEKCDVSNWDADFDYELDTDKLMEYKRIQEVSQDGSVQIIECRPPPAVESTGIIPGAIHIPGPSLLAADGTVKTEQEIKDLFIAKGVDPDQPMAFSCGAGILASFGQACAHKAGL